jgi:hypothetical protein
MKQTANAIACLCAAMVLLGVGGPAGCGGGTLGGGGDPPRTGAGGAAVIGPGAGGGRPVPGTAGSASPGSAGDDGAGAGGSAGDGRGSAGQFGAAGIGGRADGRGGTMGIGGTVGTPGVGGGAGSGGSGGATMETCPPTMSPVCGSACGNGRVDSCLRIVGRDCHLANISEDCDGTDFGPRTCQTLGYASGRLACSADCTLDWTGCSECVSPDTYVPACGPARSVLATVSSFRIAATDREVALALVDHQGVRGADTLAFARLSPSLDLAQALVLDDTSQPGPLFGASIFQAAVAPIPSGWVVAACADLGVYLHAIDAGGRDVGRIIVAQATDPSRGCQPETLSLAARPGGGPLLLWQSPEGVNAALISDDGLSAGAPQVVVPSETLFFGADAAWTGGAFQVATALETNSAAVLLRLSTVQVDGSVTAASDIVVGAIDGPPRLAAGTGGLRVVFPGVPPNSITPDGLGIVWQPLGDVGQPLLPPVVVANYPTYFGVAPAIAFGDDTLVLIGGYGHEELALVHVLPGGLVAGLRGVVKAPALEIDVYDMARRGTELVVGWLSPSTGALGLARVTPGVPEAD